MLWDLDGTLVDTEPYWIATEYALAEEHGATWSQEHALQLVGNDLIHSGHYIREVMGLQMSAEDVVEYLLDGVVAQVEEEVPWRPGAVELLAELRTAEVPCGLVTMSYQRFVAPILAAPAPGDVPGDRHRRPGLARQATPGALPDRCRSTRAGAERLRGDRGLQHRRDLRRGRPAARCWSSRTTSTWPPDPDARLPPRSADVTVESLAALV